jgi:hypothetical protein
MFDGGERGFIPHDTMGYIPKQAAEKQNHLEAQALVDSARLRERKEEGVPKEINSGDATEKIVEMEAELPPDIEDELNAPEITIEEGNDSEDGGEADAA